MLQGFEGHIIGVCGSKDTGKTVVVEGLVRFLTAKGFTVGTVKHVHGEIALEPKAKDSTRHLAAGADRVVAVGDGVTQVMMQEKDQGSPADLLERAAARYLFACDYVVVEGFKHVDTPKIVVTRQPDDMPQHLENVVACVYQGTRPDVLPAFKPDEIEKLVNFLFESGVLAPVGPGAHLTVNGKPVSMNEFVRRALTGVLEGFVGSLRDVEPPAEIEISIKHPR